MGEHYLIASSSIDTLLSADKSRNTCNHQQQQLQREEPSKFATNNTKQYHLHKQLACFATTSDGSRSRTAIICACAKLLKEVGVAN